MPVKHLSITSFNILLHFSRQSEFCNISYPNQKSKEQPLTMLKRFEGSRRFKETNMPMNKKRFQNEEFDKGIIIQEQASMNKQTINFR